MQHEVAKQNLLQTRPILIIEFNMNKAIGGEVSLKEGFLKNEGRGPALNALITKFELEDEDQQVMEKPCEFLLPKFVGVNVRQELKGLEELFLFLTLKSQ
jgi:hypothetical protein